MYFAPFFLSIPLPIPMTIPMYFAYSSGYSSVYPSVYSSVYPSVYSSVYSGVYYSLLLRLFLRLFLSIPQFIRLPLGAGCDRSLRERSVADPRRSAYDRRVSPGGGAADARAEVLCDGDRPIHRVHRETQEELHRSKPHDLAFV